jgi:hypothetical protein
MKAIKKAVVRFLFVATPAAWIVVGCNTLDRKLTSSWGRFITSAYGSCE